MKISLPLLFAIASAWGYPLAAAPVNFLPQPLLKETEDGFRVPQPGYQFVFPRDHGSHPDFKVEWWYLTGHLFGPDKERFGFQATFFRKANTPPREQGSGGSKTFRSDEVFLFHAALLEVESGRFIHTERLARSGWDANASSSGLSVRVGEARLSAVDGQEDRFTLDASIRAEAGFSLKLEAQKPVVVFGKDGVSRKGESATAASWYLTFPRMQARGEVRVKERLIPVEGLVWMDHEISSSQLTEEQAGWDWAGIQFEDGREIMVYRLRRKDGATDSASALSWVDREGKATYYGASEFQWETNGVWRSSESGAKYPLPVRLKAPDPVTGSLVEWILEPLSNQQELDGAVSGVPYWEGACRVLREGREVGSAYVELTGYAGALGRALR
ncbi:MAG: putative secreted hydrolase [Verrucomicrobia bacterium]|nr:MAG: putative secreted hydrolase [Verrucomicrobiota bacterium]